jgi:DNA-binding response OmpR family regulator
LITMGKLQINFSSYEAYANNQSVSMTHKEFEILKYFWQHKNETVNRDQLLSQVWGFETSTTTRTVDNFILKLRQKVEPDPANPKHILTVHGLGYKYLD